MKDFLQKGNKTVYWSTRLLVIALTTFLLWSCQNQSSNDSLFEKMDSEETGIVFNNLITENDSLNVLDYEYIYNGGGVAIADFNNDGRQDVFFTGNMVPNAMYLNRADFKFEEVSEVAGVTAADFWSSGVATVDINADGWMDLYICTNTYRQANRRQNLLLVNQGNNMDGVPTFKNQAMEYGLADTTYAMNAAFFDYDNDGDLDVFIIVNEMEGSRYPGKFRKNRSEKRFRKDKLYRNDWSEELGHPVFTDVSVEAGIEIEGYSLGLNIVDINQDGWQDVYITNDFLSDDLFYVNNGDGTFTNRAKEYFKHTSHSAMGNDVVDLNNDGLMDIIALDMLPEDNYRRKTMMGAANYSTYLNNERYGYSYQFVRNTLQLNQGTNPETGVPVFSDISMMAGIAATDWSWTPLIADFDNDTYQDIIITNGFPKDVTDRDFIDYQADNYRYAPKEMLLQQIPEVKLRNYAYRNKGNLSFEDVSKNWGINEKSFSNGAAFADLDNDGDLDYIVNNIDDQAFVYRNQLTDHYSDSTHYLRVQLQGKSPNLSALGATVRIYVGGDFYQKNNSPYRGYLSSMEPVLHFGLSKHTKVDSLLIRWPDGMFTRLQNVPSDTLLVINQQVSETPQRQEKTTKPSPLLTAESQKITYWHQELDYIDFNVQPLLPHKLSQYGPGLAVGDVNGDGRSDIYISGGLRQSGVVFVQQVDGTFTGKPLHAEDSTKRPEELGALFFDADQDGDDDLYVVHGSYEFTISDSIYQDKFYRNEGGELVLDAAALPLFKLSGSCVRAADIDHDGDLDLFVGGRVHPHQYPKAVDSYLLLNQSTSEGVRFTIANESHAPQLSQLGMVSDALWTDIDNDGWMDLLVAGEYLPLMIFKNHSGILKRLKNTGLDDKTGWWNSLTAGDFDRDGDTDYLAGNLGTNTLFAIEENYPLRAYAKDFDNNGGYDLVLSTHLKTGADNPDVREYPFHGRQALMSQMIYIRDSFKLHQELADATLPDIFTEEMLKDATILAMNYPYTSLVENKGNGQFELHPLPMEAQAAPVFGMQTMDVNGNGNLDVVMVGNDYGMELTMGRCDAFNGLVLKGNGDLMFTPLSIQESGFLVPGDGKSLVQLESNGYLHLLAGQNKSKLKHFYRPVEQEVFSFLPKDAYAIVTDNNQNSYKVEAYYGSGFLSQSGRFFIIPPGHEVQKVVQLDGTERN